MNQASEFALGLDEIQEGQRGQAGGKGYTLARLRQAGFPVPPGFVVTADAYRAFTLANGLDAVITAAPIARNPADASALIQEAFEKAEMPPEIAVSICDAYLAFGEERVAVRSSALAEDDVTTSFAGQHDTILDVAGAGAVLEAVRHCWNSLWSERALAYRTRMPLAPASLNSWAGLPAMAVVVQRMVPAAHSGVAFTLDPVSGRRDVVVVEAVAGGGAPLVGGRVTPQRYVVRKEDGNPEVLPHAYALSPAQLAAVTALAQKIAAWAGQAQDVEWVLGTDGGLYLLQARPISAPPPSPALEAAAEEGGPDRVVARWTRDNVGEVLPAPVTPLTWSVLDPLGNRSFAGVLRRLGVRDYPDAGLFGHFHGRVYFNQTLFQKTMSRFQPSYGGWRAIPRLAVMAVRVFWLLSSLPREGGMAVRQIVQQRSSEKDLDLETLTPRDLLAQLAIWRRVEDATMEVHLSVSAIAHLLYQALDKLLDRWGNGTATAADLTAGLAGLRSAEAGQSLAAIARRVRQDRSVRDLVLVASPESLANRLTETKEGQAVLEQLDTFLVEHGHCASQEFELAAPRWRDDWSIVFRVLQAQVRAVPAKEPAVDSTAVRLKATVSIKERVTPVKHGILRGLLRRTQGFIVLRENLKYYFVMAHSRLRDLYLALATRFAGAGWLASLEDIFYLTAQEVTALADGHLEQVASRVAERRNRWETDLRGSPPAIIDQLADGRFCPVSPRAHRRDGSGQLLHGFAASPGAYVGRARVLLTVADGADIEPGEVVVAPAASPGWAPLLLAAGALVTEIGGTLSHSAIIAREYGLPAVLNVADATRYIHTGQMIRVDGSRGTVELMGPGESESE